MATGMVIASAVGAGAQIYQGVKAKDASQANANIIREQADYQRKQYEYQAGEVLKQGNSYKGTLTASTASSGVKRTEGSPLEIMRKTEQNILSDNHSLRKSAINASQSGLNQAEALEQQGKDALTSSIIGAGTSFLGSVAGIGLDNGWFGPGVKGKKDTTPSVTDQSGYADMGFGAFQGGSTMKAYDTASAYRNQSYGAFGNITMTPGLWSNKTGLNYKNTRANAFERGNVNEWMKGWRP